MGEKRTFIITDDADIEEWMRVLMEIGVRATYATMAAGLNIFASKAPGDCMVCGQHHQIFSDETIHLMCQLMRALDREVKAGPPCQQGEESDNLQ